VKRNLFKEADVRTPGSVSLVNGWNAAVEFAMYGENFRAAGRALVDQLQADETFMNSVSTSASFRSYPAFYLYRHAFELALKGIVVAGSGLVGQNINERAVYQNHSFGALGPDLERIFSQIGYGWDFGIEGYETIEDFRALLAELDEMDARSTLWRYPVTVKGTASMENEMCVSLIDFAATMDVLLEMLCGVTCSIRTPHQA
jgi:hypothetical protein